MNVQVGVVSKPVRISCAECVIVSLRTASASLQAFWPLSSCRGSGKSRSSSLHRQHTPKNHQSLSHCVSTKLSPPSLKCLLDQWPSAMSKHAICHSMSTTTWLRTESQARSCCRRFDGLLTLLRSAWSMHGCSGVQGATAAAPHLSSKHMWCTHLMPLQRSTGIPADPAGLHRRVPPDDSGLVEVSVRCELSTRRRICIQAM